MSETDKSTHKFQAAVTQVLSLVINSLYSNKEIFLRELVSNASDALDKLRFRAVTEPELLGEDPLRVRLLVDEKAGTLTISDNGIGMSRQEMEKNLGTVAHSGSREFIKRLEDAQKGDANKESVSLIGQFGVGFYSAYLVADRVDVLSRAGGSDEAFRWSSDAHETFTLEPAERGEHGTDVILHIKQEQKEFLRHWYLKELVKRYSDYIGHPIELETSEEKDGKTVKGWERLNEASALWQRPASEITDEQYTEFYKHLTHDWEDPLSRRHFKIEGTQLFSGLLFVPSRPPFDLFSTEMTHGVRLHVQRVFIMDDCEELLPRWLRFVRGVVDSEDLPLNVSRELLQDSRVVKTIRKQVIKQALDMVEELAEKDDYEKFWTLFGAVLKEGLHYDPEYKERLSKLVRWASTGGEALVSLSDYVSRMKEGQTAIYYVFGASRAMVENAPHLEILKKRGYEVLLMTDPVDQWAVTGLGDFEGKPLISAMAADLKLEETEEKDEAQAEGLGALIKRFRVVLQGQVDEVHISDRLADSPVCLVIPEGGLPPYLERMMRMQQGDVPKQKRVLEVNPGHPLVQSLRALHDKDEASEQIAEWIEVLYDQALLAEGSPVEDPNRLVTRMTSLLTAAAARQVETGAETGA